MYWPESDRAHVRTRICNGNVPLKILSGHFGIFRIFDIFYRLRNARARRSTVAPATP